MWGMKFPDFILIFYCFLVNIPYCKVSNIFLRLHIDWSFDKFRFSIGMIVQIIPSFLTYAPDITMKVKK